MRDLWKMREGKRKEFLKRRGVLEVNVCVDEKGGLVVRVVEVKYSLSPLPLSTLVVHSLLELPWFPSCVFAGVCLGSHKKRERERDLPLSCHFYRCVGVLFMY